MNAKKLYSFDEGFSHLLIIDYVYSKMIKNGVDWTFPEITICDYLVWLETKVLLLQDCRRRKKIARLYFTKIGDNEPIVIDCELLVVGHAFVRVKKIKTVHGDSINGASSEEVFMLVDLDQFLSEAEMTPRDVGIKELVTDIQQ